MSFENIESLNTIQKYGEVVPPAIIIGDRILSEGHVPIMKKLAHDLYELIKPSN